MAIAFQRETLFDIWNEVDELLQMHYEELTLHRDKIKLFPIWGSYAALERSGSLVVFTVRDEKRLIGYSAFFVNPHMHYGQLTLAMNDVLFLHPDFRAGTVGLKLIRMCEQHFEEQKRLGAEIKIVWHAKLGTNLGKLLEVMNYTAEELVYGKIL